MDTTKKCSPCFISNYRKEKGLRQEQLARLIGVTTKTLSEYEAGNIYPRINIACDIAEILGMPICSLWGNMYCKKNKTVAEPEKHGSGHGEQQR